MSAPEWFSKAVALRRQQYLETLTPYAREQYLKAWRERIEETARRQALRQGQRPLF